MSIDIRRCWLIGICAAAILGGETDADAGTATVFSDRNSFYTAISPAPADLFDTVPTGTLIPNGGSIGGVQLSINAANTVFHITSAGAKVSNPNALDKVVSGVGSAFLPGDQITFTFTTPVNAFGISFNAFGTANGSFVVTTNTGTTVQSFYDPFPGISSGHFLGFVDSGPFTSITLTEASGAFLAYGLDDLIVTAVNTAAATNFVVLGTFAGGVTFSGTVSINVTTGAITNWDIPLPSANGLPSVEFTPSNSSFIFGPVCSTCTGQVFGFGSRSIPGWNELDVLLLISPTSLVGFRGAAIIPEIQESAFQVFSGFVGLNGSQTVVDITSGSISIPPSTNAGPNQTVHQGSVVTLDGSGSTDSLGNVPLTYAWSFISKPAGSIASLSDPTSVHPGFIADQAGNYVLKLVVTNTIGMPSSPATVTISTSNTPPVAEAGPDQAITVIGTTVSLDGSHSYDVDGDPITYSWSLTSKPATSSATLSDAASPRPTFVADVHGNYTIQLVVSDPWVSSQPSTVTISFTNVAPVANAGMSQSAVVGDTVTINGSASSDANGDSLTYLWTFASVPTGSLASINSPIQPITSFVPDLPGTYVVQLLVNDGYVNSLPSTIQVQVVSQQTAAINATNDVEIALRQLPGTAFQNKNMQNALLNKLNAVIANIESGNYQGALDQLQYDILAKTDGCSATSAPDKNDWITVCASQGQVYALVTQAIARVREVI